MRISDWSSDVCSSDLGRIQKNGAPLLDDPVFAARLARVEIALENLRIMHLRILANVQAGGAPGAESSMLKIVGTELRQGLAALDRKSVVEGKRGSVRVDLGGRRILKKKKKQKN